MAWIIRQGVEGAAVVHFEMSPPCTEIRPSHDYYKERGIRHGRLYRSAVDIGDSLWPQRARLRSNRKSLPSLLGFCSFHGVSERFRSAIEELEPGVHEFRRVQVEHRNGTPFPEPYYALNARYLVVDAVNWEETTAPSKVLGDQRVLLPLHPASAQQTVFHHSAVSGKHFWITDEIMGGELTISDKLHRRMEREHLLAHMQIYHIREK